MVSDFKISDIICEFKMACSAGQFEIIHSLISNYNFLLDEIPNFYLDSCRKSILENIRFIFSNYTINYNTIETGFFDAYYFKQVHVIECILQHFIISTEKIIEMISDNAFIHEPNISIIVLRIYNIPNDVIEKNFFSLCLEQEFDNPVTKFLVEKSLLTSENILNVFVDLSRESEINLKCTEFLIRTLERLEHIPEVLNCILSICSVCENLDMESLKYLINYLGEMKSERENIIDEYFRYFCNMNKIENVLFMLNNFPIKENTIQSCLRK